MPDISEDFLSIEDYKNAISKLKFASGGKDISVMEVVIGDEGATPTVLKATLKPAELRHWIVGSSDIPEALQGRPKTNRGSLRLILGQPVEKTAKDKPKAVEFQACHTINNVLPYDRSTYDSILEAFQLSKLTTEVMLGGVAPSSVPHILISGTGKGDCSEGKCGCNLKITTKTKGGALLGLDAFVSLSYCFTNHITRAVLFGTSPEQAEFISSVIERLAPLASFPALLPAILCDIQVFLLSRKSHVTWSKLLQIEAASGKTAVAVMGKHGLLHRQDVTDPALITNAGRVAQLSITWENYSASVCEMIQRTQEIVQHNVFQEANGLSVIFPEQSRAVREFLQLVSAKAEATRSRTQHLKERARIQMEMIYNHLSHRSNQINLIMAIQTTSIAKEARKDSSMMKSIAILTMTFLPGTFIATLFTTPGFQTFNPSLSLYWFITGPVTILALIIWGFWTVWSTRRIDKADNSEPCHGSAEAARKRKDAGLLDDISFLLSLTSVVDPSEKKVVHESCPYDFEI